MNHIDEIKRTWPLIIDGGLSNVLERKGFNLNHKLWTAHLISEQADAIISAHLDYIKAGAQCITSATYQASIPGLKEAGFPEKESVQLILKSVELVEAGINKAMQLQYIDERPLIAASIGPYGAYLADGSEYTGKYQISNQELKDFHDIRMRILDESGADILAVETIPSLQEAKVLSELLERTQKKSWVSFSCQNETFLNDGSKITDAISLFSQHDNVIALGVNCTNPKYISGIITTIKKLVNQKKIIVYPNSGEAYNAKKKTWMGISDPELFLPMAQEWSEKGADIIGGCCRIGPEHIKKLVRNFDPRKG